MKKFFFIAIIFFCSIISLSIYFRNVNNEDFHPPRSNEDFYLPKGMFLYPTAKPALRVYKEGHPPIVFSCPDDISKVLDFYLTKLADNGWKIETKYDRFPRNARKGFREVALNCYCRGRECSIHINGDESETSFGFLETNDIGKTLTSNH